ncbi:HFL124Wp [Eremothecium sinecaudum]|uniref:Nuclear rim protein 1 n=1 Tax=Eremothecium sinecaudum TaxID=45286 RepID=A0A0X8HUK0_9SACH|nr:HFL124Wp [Eremothecium sinecaudum]AMD21732.1 HFL124Wp [Eremothecium sinecaudum]
MSFRISKQEQHPIDPNAEAEYVAEEFYSDDEDGNETLLEWVVRHTISSPYDYYLSINEDIELIDWDSKAKTVARPLGSFLTFLLFTIRFLQDNLVKPNYQRINKNNDGFDLSRSKKIQEYEYFAKYQTARWDSSNWHTTSLGVLDKIFKVMVMVLVFLNVMLTYRFLFRYFQSYSLFYLKERPKSNNVTKKSIHDLAYRYVEDVSRGSLWSMLKYVFRREKALPDEQDDEYYYELRKWSPNSFLTSLFVSFSPISVAYLIFLDVSFISAIPAIISEYIFWFVIINRYEDRILDEKAVFRGIEAELDAKILKPSTSVKTQDAIVDATPYGDGFVRFYPSFTTTRCKVFSTYSLNGEIVKEKYSTKTRRFEDVINGNAINRIHNHDERFKGNAHLSHKYAGAVPNKYVNYIRHETAVPRYLNRGFMSSSSAPSTPLMQHGINQNQADYSMMGNVSRGDNIYNDVSRNDTLRDYRRHHSTSPLKRDVLHPSMVLPDEGHSHFLPNPIEFEHFMMQDMINNGRSPAASTCSHKPSRNNSVSPFRLSRRGSVENRQH